MGISNVGNVLGLLLYWKWWIHTNTQAHLPVFMKHYIFAKQMVLESSLWPRDILTITSFQRNWTSLLASAAFQGGMALSIRRGRSDSWLWDAEVLSLSFNHLIPDEEKDSNAMLRYAKLLQSCLTLCDPIDSSPPGSPIPGILQARTLEWVAISFSNAWKWSRSVLSDS